MHIDIRTVLRDKLHVAATVLSHGMADNPLHVKVFGAEPGRRQRRLQRFLLLALTYVHANGKVLGAYDEGELVGVLGMIRPGRCQPSVSDRLRFGRAVLTSAPPAILLRIYRWLAAWKRNDLPEPHWHIGPLAVLPASRRRGIGRRLMVDCCQHLDALAAAAWLETDLEINVKFYQTLGFVVDKQEPVLGVPNWFMSRRPEYDMPAATTPSDT